VTTYNKYAGAAAYDPLAIAPQVGYDPTRGGWKPWPLQKNGIDDGYFIPASGAKPFATDSASAATAWATGYKTDDGNIAWKPGDPPDGAVPTIAELARAEEGAAIGVVSTVPFTHATPAAHVAHNVSRSNYHAMANEILKTVKPDVVIGGGHPRYGTTYMPAALYDDMKANTTDEYAFVERLAGVDGGVSVRAAAKNAADDGQKLFGLYGGAGGNFEPPVPSDTPGHPAIARGSTENPLLKDATVAALTVLEPDPDGFFLMVEQGDIDWANHANNYSWMVGTTWDLDEAVQAAVAWVGKPCDDVTWLNTTIIVTADHANSYMRLNPDKPLGKGDLPTPPTAPCAGYGGAGVCTYPNGDVTYRAVDHTNELTRLYGLGFGSLAFRKEEGQWYRGSRLIDNTQIFDALASILGVSERSPLVPVPVHLPHATGR
jgi:alkaline phosphatase